MYSNKFVQRSADSDHKPTNNYKLTSSNQHKVKLDLIPRVFSAVNAKINNGLNSSANIFSANTPHHFSVLKS